MDSQPSRYDELVAAELARARAKFPPFRSAMEGWAILQEEIDEYWEEARKQYDVRTPERLLQELVQIGAMTRRLIEDGGQTWTGWEATLDSALESHHEVYAYLRDCSDCLLREIVNENAPDTLDVAQFLYDCARSGAEDVCLCRTPEPSSQQPG